MRLQVAVFAACSCAPFAAAAFSIASPLSLRPATTSIALDRLRPATTSIALDRLRREDAAVLSGPLRKMSNAPSSSSALAADASAALDLGLYTPTPLLRSGPLSALAGRSVYIKLDCLQSSGSFKDRGMAHLCQTLKSTKGTTRLVSSSGGNAGLAVATVGGELGMEVQVVVPETTKALVIDKLKKLGADVTVHGANWNAADTLARERAAKDDAAEYVSPYDHPLLWTGHSTVVDELMREMNEREEKMGAVVASVGGGGLICGIFEGLARHSAYGTTVIAAETEGAASFGKAFLSGKPVRLDSIDSVATSLGALEVTEVALSRAAEHQSKGGDVRASICTDAEAVDACVKFAEDHRVLVEPACGAALAAVYSERLREEVLQGLEEGSSIVVEVCGGSGVSLELLDAWKRQFLSE